MSVAIVLLVIVGLAILAVITDPDERIRQEALRRHPSGYFKAGNYAQSTRTEPGKFDLSKARVLPPGVGWAPTFDEATEAAIQAINVIDDGKALVREAEDYLRGRSR